MRKMYTIKEPQFVKNGRRKNIRYTTNKRGCWICISHSGDKDGYPKIGRYNKKHRASRYIYKLYKGSFNKNLVIRHMCDNFRCINPNHLLLGSKKDNTQDMIKKLKYFAPNKKLSIEQIISIKKSSKSLKELSKLYKVNVNHICDIRKGRHWNNIND